MPVSPSPPTPPIDSVGVNWNDLQWNTGSFTRFSYRAKFKPGPPEDEPAIVTPRRPVWNLKIFWDGDLSAETDYSDYGHTDLPAATEFRVLKWGQVVQTAKGFNTFDTFRVTLQNLVDSTTGFKVSDEWTFADPPEGKLVELHVKVIQPETGPLSGFTKVFTGRIVEVPRADETHVEIVMASISEFIDRDLLETIKAADFPTAPSPSLAMVKPAVFGEVFNHEAVLVGDNVRAILSSSLTSVAVSVEVETDPGFASSGTVTIDSETITYTAITPGTPATLTGVVRGTSGTTATDHPAGVEVIEVGDMTFLVSSHPNTLVSNPRLVDADENIRQIPSDVGVVINSGTTPSTVVLDAQPVLTSLASTAGSSFKFVDLDSADLTQSSIGGATPTQEVVEQCLGRSTTFVDTNFVTMTNGFPIDQVTGYRSEPIVGIPEGAVLKKAYAVVEGYSDGPDSDTVKTTTDSELLSTTAAPFTLNVADTTGFTGAAGNAVFYIGEEQFLSSSFTATSFSVTQRNVNGFAGGPFTHPAGSTVKQGPAFCFVRNPAGASTTIVGQDSEGDFNTITDTPEEIDAATGLIAVTKGFEDEHTHVIPGDHTHTTNTSHEHDASDVIEWVPDIIQSRQVVAPTGGCTFGGLSVNWSPHQQRNALGDSANGQVSDGASWVNNPTDLPPGSLAGHYYLVGSSSAASPNDEREVVGIEVIIATRAAAPFTIGSGTMTFLWKGPPCVVTPSQNTTSFAACTFSIGQNLNPAAELFGTTSNVLGVNGDVYQTSFQITRSPSVYNANLNSVFLDTFTRNLTGLGIKVKDFVSSDFGGSVSGQRCWFHWQTPELNIQSVKFRLDVKSVTSTETIPAPLDNTANPDTDPEQPLKRSSMSWFDLGTKITSASDLIDLRMQVKVRNSNDFPDNFLLLRMFYALEFETTTVSGDSITPKRLICDVQGLAYPARKSFWFIREVIHEPTLLNLPYSLIPATNFSTLSPKVVSGSGVQREQIKASEIVNDMCASSQLLPVWNGEGELTLTYLEDEADIQSSIAPVVFFAVDDLQPTEGGISRPRAPIDQIVNDVTIRALPNAVTGGFDITSQGEDATSKSVYGVTKTLEEDTSWLTNQIGADKLRDHRLDYGAESPSRVTFRVHLTQKSINNTLPGAIIGVDLSPDFVSASLQVERRLIDLGVGRTGSVPFVEFQCVDRS